MKCQAAKLFKSRFLTVFLIFQEFPSLGFRLARAVRFRIPDAAYDAWADRLNSLGIPNSGKVDRFWFHSLYFREPNGILF